MAKLLLGEFKQFDKGQMMRYEIEMHFKTHSRNKHDPINVDMQSERQACFKRVAINSCLIINNI